MQKTLGFRFADSQLLQQALTHRSAVGANNERFEFLGDAVLDFVVSDIVFASHTSASEGDLSRLRASLVNDASLAKVAKGLGVGDHLILGEGEKKSGGHHRNSILADALEAIFAAVYLDAGIEAAEKVIRQAFGERLVNLPPIDSLRDPKTRLQEWLQARAETLPAYELVETSGKAHNRRFVVCCSIRDGARMSTGSGTTRRKAEQEAAAEMLDKLSATPSS
ncbi:MAG: ribonuclease III [Gammaproteobacteria bacterium]|nr:ribonuclease III [Gammaproteobacteria bacterium]